MDGGEGIRNLQKAEEAAAQIVSQARTGLLMSIVLTRPFLRTLCSGFALTIGSRLLHQAPVCFIFVLASRSL